MSAIATAAIATTQAKSAEPERAFTARELWQVVEEFGLTLYPPRITRRKDWLVIGVDKDDRLIYEAGETAIGAVENYLRRIGGTVADQA